MVERLADADVLLEDLTPEQRDAVTTSATPLCIIAGAGSGKTRVLNPRIAWQASTGAIDPRRVLAVTFTRRAAGELRRRTLSGSVYATTLPPARSTRSPWRSSATTGKTPTAAHLNPRTTDVVPRPPASICNLI